MGDVSITGPSDTSMNLHEIVSENELLKVQLRQVTDKLEEQTQESHSLRSRLEVSLRVQNDYQSEIESLHQQEEHQKAALESVLQHVKEDQALLLRNLEEKVESLEMEMHEQKALHSRQLEEVKKELLDSESNGNATSVASLQAELQEAVSALEHHRLTCQQHQELNHMLLVEKSKLLDELQNVREQLEIVQEKFNIAKIDLMEQAETLEELRESLAVAQNELSSLKAESSDKGARGNSLFAEVEDKRQAMLKRCTSLTSKYTQMKKEYSAKCAEITRLKTENLHLCRKWEEEERERDNREVWLADNFEIRIKELQNMINDLRKNEKPVFIEGDSKALKYADLTVEKSRKEVAKLQEEMERRSAERLNEAKALYAARSHLQNFRAKTVCLQVENQLLRDKLEEANITDIPPPQPVTKSQTSVKEEPKHVLCSACSLPLNNATSTASATISRPQVNTPPTANECKAKFSSKFLPVSAILSKANCQIPAQCEGTFTASEIALISSPLPPSVTEEISEQSPASRAANSLTSIETDFKSGPSLASEMLNHSTLQAEKESPSIKSPERMEPVLQETQKNCVLSKDCTEVNEELCTSKTSAVSESTATSQPLTSNDSSPNGTEKVSNVESPESVIQQLDSISVGLDNNPKPVINTNFVVPKVPKPLRVLRAEKLEEAQQRGQGTLSTVLEVQDVKDSFALTAENDKKLQESCTGMQSNDQEAEETNEKRMPRRSILAQPSKVCLVLQENVKPARRVSFAVNEATNPSTSVTSTIPPTDVMPNLKSCPEVAPSKTKTRFSRVPPQKTYRTSFVVSKENVDTE